MKVGIDLSSTNTGLVILSDDNKLIFHDNFQLWDNNRFVIASKVNEMIDYIELKNPFHKFFMIGIELADFKNANITNRFHFLTGIIISELAHRNFVSAIYDQDNKLAMQLVKLFNSNEWQRFLLEIYKPYIKYKKQNKKIIYHVSENAYSIRPCKDVKYMKNIIMNAGWLDKRSLLKLLSRLWTQVNCVEYEDTWTEDECDAYCIAYFLEQLRDRTQMHQEVKARNKVKEKSEKQALRDKYKKEHKINKLKDIVIKYKSKEKLTKAQQRALEKAEMELKELKNESI